MNTAKNTTPQKVTDKTVLAGVAAILKQKFIPTTQAKPKPTI